MRKLTVYKNDDGYGPKRRPRIKPGSVRNLVSEDGAVNRIVKAVQVPDNKAGNRCADCDLNVGSTDLGQIKCLCNNHSLVGEHVWTVSICTLKSPRTPGGGVYVVFKDLDKVMESL